MAKRVKPGSSKQKTKQVSSRNETRYEMDQPVELTQHIAQGNEWLNPTEAMKYIGVSAATLYKLMDNGILPFYTIKGIRKRRIKKADLEALMAKGVPGSLDG